jgi:glycosyltransferase involved in cell wall biosynthesis
MKQPISVVIVCKNEAGVIEQVLDSARRFSDNIVVYDSGSTDGTLDILRRRGVQLHEGPWMGYGKTKQHAVQLAQHDWILSIDADEVPDALLQQALNSLQLQDARTVYKIRFKNFLGAKHLKWGEWGGDDHIRLFNRTVVNWNEAKVHESLVIPPGVQVQKLSGSIEHHTMKDLTEYSQKMVRYALLNAEKYAEQGKRANWVKLYISPRFTFFKHYLLQLGFLDGWEGLVAARMTAFYTFLKYARLREIKNAKCKM